MGTVNIILPISNTFILYSYVFYSYPVRYIYRHFHKFFEQHSITTKSIIPMIHDENEYLLLHHQLLLQPTPTEHARAA